MWLDQSTVVLRIQQLRWEEAGYPSWGSFDYPLQDDPSPKNINKFLDLIVDPDDAPILAAAALYKVDCLVTWDKKHFLKTNIKTGTDMKIFSPGAFLTYFRRYIED